MALSKKLQLRFSESQLKSQIQLKNNWTGNEKIQSVWGMKKLTIGQWLEKKRSIHRVLKWSWENYPHALKASSWCRKKLGWLRFECVSKKWWQLLWTTAPCRLGVIVMTFWYVLRNGLNFFELFKTLFSLGIDHDPHVHMTYVYSLFLCFILHMITWPREVIIILRSFWLWSSILWTHPHPHFLLFPPQPHHPYTPRLYQPTRAPPGEGHHLGEKCGRLANLSCTSEDFLHSRLGTAKVERVLPSRKSARPDEPCCQEPSPD